MAESAAASAGGAGGAGGGAGSSEQKRFEIKKWNAVALWSWGASELVRVRIPLVDAQRVWFVQTSRSTTALFAETISWTCVRVQRLWFLGANPFKPVLYAPRRHRMSS